MAENTKRQTDLNLFTITERRGVLTAMQDCWLRHRALQKNSAMHKERLSSCCVIVYPLMQWTQPNCSHAWHLCSFVCWMKLWSYFLLSALHIGLTRRETHETNTFVNGWSQMYVRKHTLSRLAHSAVKKRWLRPLYWFLLVLFSCHTRYFVKTLITGLSLF